MHRFKSRCAAVLVGFLCAGWFGAACAIDPLVLFLLRMVRDSAISAAIERGVEASREKSRPEDQAAALPRLAPLPATEGQWLRTLIDESFVHLTSGQREELYASLTRMLNDPRHVELRSAILAEFTGQAIAMRDAHRRLSGLTPDQMKDIAVEARREYERLPAEQRRQMLQVLQHGIPGMPRTLNDLMLAEFGAAAPAAP
jgi:hypothetical protein